MTIIREWMDLLRVLHGVYNAVVVLALFYQGWLGLKIMKARRAGGPRDLSAVKRHRANGPVLVLLGIAGYFAGPILVYIDMGHFFEYPAHHLTGGTIVVLLGVAYLISRRINTPDSVWRIPHFIVGLAILGAYLVQLFLGLNILL